MQAEVRSIRAEESVRQYLVRVTRATREHQAVELGVSPRHAGSVSRQPGAGGGAAAAASSSPTTLGRRWRPTSDSTASTSARRRFRGGCTPQGGRWADRVRSAGAGACNGRRERAGCNQRRCRRPGRPTMMGGGGCAVGDPRRTRPARPAGHRRQQGDRSSATPGSVIAIILFVAGLIFRQGSLILIAGLALVSVGRGRGTGWRWARWTTGATSASGAFLGETVELDLTVSNRKLLPVSWLRIDDRVPMALPLEGSRCCPPTCPPSGWCAWSTRCAGTSGCIAATASSATSAASSPSARPIWKRRPVRAFQPQAPPG